MHDYDAFLTQRALRRVMGDSVHFTHPVTVDILLNVFHHFDWSSQLHICMHAAFLVAFFSFLRISNLVPCTLASCQSDNAYFLKREDVSFTASGAVLRVYRTKTIQSLYRSSPIPCCVQSQHFRIIFAQYLARLVRPCSLSITVVRLSLYSPLISIGS